MIRTSIRLALWPASWLRALALLAAIGAASSDPASAEPPVVTLQVPKNGQSSKRIVTVQGTVSERALRTVTLVVNGTERTIGASDGRFSSTLVLSRGQNDISVYAQGASGETGSDSASFYSRVPYKDMAVVLTWDTDGTDVDLWVQDPDGESCGYSNRDTEIGGSLDVDVTDGYGPETFTLENAIPGHYRVTAVYYSDRGHPQTGYQLTVILFEGTDKESRRVFDGVLTHTDSRTHVTDVSIEPESFEVGYK
jgi:uncharacterized protein YfaP (DUF2135 family)